MSRLLALYMQTDTLFERDKHAMGPLRDFPEDQSDWEDRGIEEAGQELAGRVPGEMPARR
mgnify:CR=1 FL=1